jgi:alkanesulfonate monooxygenase SsuD/methylene tetrahydromethanopterin reductase-like flavin-dependent oxidoreductase (luciferase family)
VTDGAGGRVRVGLTLPSFQSDPERVLAVARAAEDAGLDGVFLFDHLFRARGDALDAERRPALELFTMTAAVAAATDRIAVGTLVARATLRPPGTTRAAFDTLARIAPGRIIAGLGAGDDDSLAEDTAFGVMPVEPATVGSPDLWVASARPADPPQTGWAVDGPRHSGPWPTLSQPEVARYRVARFEASVGALTGREYPVWVAGRSPASIRLAATAGGWNMWGATPGTFALAGGKVRAALVDAGRDPAAFTCTWGGLAVLAATDSEAKAKWDRLGGGRGGIVHGTPPEVADQLAAYAAAGAAWVILGPIDSSDPANADLLAESRRRLAAVG